MKTKKYYWIGYVEVIGDFKESPLIEWLRGLGGEEIETVSTDNSSKFGYKGEERKIEITRWVEGGFALLCF